MSVRGDGTMAPTFDINPARTDPVLRGRVVHDGRVVTKGAFERMAGTPPGRGGDLDDAPMPVPDA